MRITCEACGKVHVADDRLAGRSFRMQCKRCGSAITVGAVPAVSLPAPPPPGPAAVDGEGAATSGEAPVFTFGGEDPPRPPGDPVPAAAVGRSPAPAGADAGDAFADFSRELQEFCEDLERSGPATAAVEPPAPATAPGTGEDAGGGGGGTPAAPGIEGAGRVHAAEAASTVAAGGVRAPRRKLAPVVALVAIAAAVAAWLLARPPGGTAAPAGSVAGGATSAVDRPAAAPDRPVAPPPSLPAPPAPAPAPAEARPVVAPAPELRERPAAPATAPPTRAPAPPSPKAAPPSSPAAAVPSAPPDPPVGAAREPASPSRPDLPPRDQRAAQAQLAGLSSAFDECLAEARRSDPELLRGPRSVVLTLTVRPSGRTAYPTLDDAQLSGTPLGACIKGRAGALVFPEAGGEPVRVRLQLELGP